LAQIGYYFEVTVLTLKSELDTQRFAKALAKVLSGGISVGLRGDLGAGKTTLVRHLVEALGGASSQVASPSFALQYDYSVRGDSIVEHWDIYRLNVLPEELLEPPDSSTLRLIEWPDKAPGLVDDLDLLIEILVQDDGTREVRFSGRLRDKIERDVSERL
jgi:tRNA threonylcarbamoyl adenosine modification protein YjeE